MDCDKIKRNADNPAIADITGFTAFLKGVDVIFRKQVFLVSFKIMKKIF